MHHILSLSIASDFLRQLKDWQLIWCHSTHGDNLFLFCSLDNQFNSLNYFSLIKFWSTIKYYSNEFSHDYFWYSPWKQFSLYHIWTVLMCWNKFYIQLQFFEGLRIIWNSNFLLFDNIKDILRKYQLESSMY